MNKFAVGEHMTYDGRVAMVDAVTSDGLLVGRINRRRDEGQKPEWAACLWDGCGQAEYKGCSLLPKGDRVVAKYFLSVYRNGHATCCKTLDHAITEARVRGEFPLCRVEVNINVPVGEGLR